MSRKRKNKKSPIAKYLAFTVIIMSVITLFLIYFIDILPLKYFKILCILLGVLALILSMLVLSKNRKISFFGGFISTIYSILLILITIYELNTIDFLKKIGNDDYITLNYSVIVLKNSEYKKIEDIENKKIGIASDLEDNSVSKIKKEIKFTTKKLSTNIDLLDNLDNKKIDAIVLEDSYISLLKDEDESFNSKYKSIYHYSIDIKNTITENKAKITKEPFNIFISGIDTYGSINSVSRSDVNMVVTVNPNTKKIVLTSIPRDYYVKLHSKKSYDKLTHSGIYGIDETVKTVEDFLDIDINYYFKINFTSLVEIVDAIGDIEVDSKYKFTSQDGYSYNEGLNKLDGKKALSFSRERKSLPEGDKSRNKNQQAVLTAIIEKATNTSIITKYNSLLKSLDKSFITNLSDKEIKDFIKMQIDKNIKWDISYVNLDGFDAYDYTYSYSKTKLYVMLPDKTSIKEASKIINSNFKNKK